MRTKQRQLWQRQGRRKACKQNSRFCSALLVGQHAWGARLHLRWMATEVAPVVGAVLELSRQVLVQSKHLADLINVEGTTEDAIIDAAKLTAGITAQLYNTLAEAVQHGSSDQALKTSLLNSAKEVRAAILDLIQSTKEALLNPFDFQATQKVQSCIHGDTPITLASGVSMKIKDLVDLTEVKLTMLCFLFFFFPHHFRFSP